MPQGRVRYAIESQRMNEKDVLKVKRASVDELLPPTAGKVSQIKKKKHYITTTCHFNANAGLFEI